MQKTKKLRLLILFVIGIFMTSMVPLYGEEYEALKDLDTVKAVFDFRNGDPMNVYEHLQLVYKTYTSESVKKISKKPSFVVVFMDISVKLISTDSTGFSSDEQKTLKEMAGLISKMDKAGIKLEVCLFAAEYFKIDPESFLPEIRKVGNGWVSSIGYQNRGYGLVPVY